MTDFFEHIGAYKNGELTDQSLAAFESELASNQELQAAVDNHDVVEELFELMFEDDIRQVMRTGQVAKDLGKTKLEITHNKRQVRSPFLRNIAASLLFFVASGCGLSIYTNYQYGHDQMLANHYTKPQNPDSIKTDNPDIKDDIVQAKNLFDLNRFDESKVVFEQLDKKVLPNDQKDVVNFYLGNIALLQNEIKEGIDYFSITNDQRKYTYLAQLYFLDKNILALEELHFTHPNPVSDKLLESSSSILYKLFK